MELRTPCWIMSDAHLGVAPAAHEAAFTGWTAAAARSAGSVVINGDLFEFWFEWRHVLPRAGVRAVVALERLAATGVPVLFVAGNHDCWGGDWLTSLPGLQYTLTPWRGRIGPWEALIAHGDGLRAQEDRGYRALARVLRHPWSHRAFSWLHPDAGAALARWSSHTSRNTRPRDGGEGLRQVGLRTLAADPALDLVVHGHSHVAALERAPGGGIYANPGAWLDMPSYLVVEDARILRRGWTGSAEGDQLDVLDRRAKEALPQP
jgi:UDP-2,3-diacylglucosamine hydrolase